MLDGVATDVLRGDESAMFDGSDLLVRIGQSLPIRSLNGSNPTTSINSIISSGRSTLSWPNEPSRWLRSLAFS